MSTCIIDLTLDGQDDSGCYCCVICRDSIVESQLCHVGCCHRFHVDCITPWLRVNSSCPLCQSPAVFLERLGFPEDSDCEIMRSPVQRVTPGVEMYEHTFQ